MAIDRDLGAASFDPRSWGGGTTPTAAAPPSPPAPPPAPPAAPRAPPRRMVLAGIASAAILIAGASAAWLSRAPHPVAVTAATPSAAPSATPAAQEAAPLARRALTLADASRLAAALTASGIAPDQAKAAIASIGPALVGRTGELHVVLSLDLAQPNAPQLARLEASFLDSSGAVLSRATDGGFSTTRVAASLKSVLHVVSGQMDDDSFYTSAVTAGVIDSLVPEIIRALSFDFDFQQEIHAGDVFEIGYEQETNAQGDPVGLPHLALVSLTTQKKSRTFFWFKPPGAEGGWFDGNGASVTRSLMRTPVDGARITSKFGMREHPIYFVAKLHKGVDFGSPIGTPIYAAGSGVVEIASPSASAGNWLWLRHDNGWQTVYMHMNTYMPGAHVGDRVTQGQQIGEVGTTGHSTGPHLHYEVHIDGQPVDPLGIQTDSTVTLSGAERAAFLKERDRIDVARALQGR